MGSILHSLLCLTREQRVVGTLGLLVITVRVLVATCQAATALNQLSSQQELQELLRLRPSQRTSYFWKNWNAIRRQRREAGPVPVPQRTYQYPPHGVRHGGYLRVPIRVPPPVL